MASSMLQVEEWYRANVDSLDTTQRSIIDSMFGLIDELEGKITSITNARRVEVLEEQVYFRDQFISSIEHWVSTMSKNKKNEYSVLASNAQHDYSPKF